MFYCTAMLFSWYADGVVGGFKLLFCYINFAKCDQKCGFFLIGNYDPWAACYTIRHLAANSMQDLFMTII